MPQNRSFLQSRRCEIPLRLHFGLHFQLPADHRDSVGSLGNGGGSIILLKDGARIVCQALLRSVADESHRCFQGLVIHVSFEKRTSELPSALHADADEGHGLAGILYTSEFGTAGSAGGAENGNDILGIAAGFGSHSRGLGAGYELVQNGSAGELSVLHEQQGDHFHTVFREIVLVQRLVGGRLRSGQGIQRGCHGSGFLELGVRLPETIEFRSGEGGRDGDLFGRRCRRLFLGWRRGIG